MSVGWETKPLGEIYENLDRQRIPITKRDRVKGEYPYYGASGIVDYVDKYIFDEELLLVSEDGANLLARTYPIAFSVSGKIWVNNHAHVLRFDNRHTQKFVEYYLNSIKLDDYVSGMAQPKLNQKSLNSIMIPIPPIEEQRRIVAVLDEALAGVQQATANTERNLANTQELFDAHLQAIFANIYESHELVKMSDLSTDITDGDHSPPPKSQTGIPFITISNINKETHKIDFSDTFVVPEEYYRNLKDKRKPMKGDLLYTVTGSFGIPVVVDFEEKFCFQRHIGLIRPTTQTNTKWLYYLVLSPQLSKQALDRATGTAQKTVSLKTLRNFDVPKVPLNEQRRIVAQLDDLAAETQRLQAIYRQKLAALQELKQSILQQAFTP